MDKRSTYFSEREYNGNSKIGDEEVKKIMDYWEGVLGKDIFNIVEHVYGYTTKQLFGNSNYKVTNDMNGLVSVERIYRDKQWEAQEVFYDGNVETLLFSNYYLPFLKVGTVHFQNKVETTIDRAIMVGFTQALLQCLSMVSTGVLVFELHLEKMEGNLIGENPQEEYRYYNDKMLTDHGYIAKLFNIYPCLERLVYECIEYCTHNFVDYFIRLKKDYRVITKSLFGGKDCIKIDKLIVGGSDSHQRGARVIIAELSNGKKLVYKPHSLQMEKAYQQFVFSLSQHSGRPLRKFEVIDCGTYGWEEFVEARECKTEEELKSYYYRFGEILFVSYLLNTTDMHVENVIACGEYPFIIDAETVLDNVRIVRSETAGDIINEKIRRSVLYSGLLPAYRYVLKGKGINMSAINGKEDETIPILSPVLKQQGTSEMHFEYEYPKTKKNNNLATLEGVFVKPSQFMREICAGFECLYRYCMTNKHKVCAALTIFENINVRHIVQDTQRYSMLLHTSFNPDFMQNGRDRQLMLCTLLRDSEKIQGSEEIAKCEINDMLHMDIPYFYSNTSSTSLFGTDGQGIENYFKKSSLDMAIAKVGRLGLKDLGEQLRLIKISLTDINDAETIHNKPTITQYIEKKISFTKERAIRAVEIIYEQLIDTMVVDKRNGSVNWLGVTAVGNGENAAWSIRPLGTYLYDGLSGLALFFAAFGRVNNTEQPKKILHAICTSLFKYTDELYLGKRDFSKECVGGFLGEASLLYTYTVLYKLSGNVELLHYAQKHFSVVAKLVNNDNDHDILFGNAGAILAIIALYKVDPKEELLDCAEKAAKILAQAQSPSGGWKSGNESHFLAGFSHGAAGIIYSLAMLYSVRPKGYLQKAIHNGLEFENTLYDPAMNNWKDVRDDVPTGHWMWAWCHGPAGILLSRMQTITSAAAAHDRDIIHADMIKCARALESKVLDNNCLCHGNLGNTEILKSYACSTQDNTLYQKTMLMRSCVVESLIDGTADCGDTYLYGYRFPGFMTGLAGMGYSLLRDIDAELPCVLGLQ